MDLEYVILSWKVMHFSANIERNELFFLESKQPYQPSCLSLTHTPLWVSEFLITIFPMASYTTEMAWAIHSKPVCWWTLFILHQLHNCNASLHLVTALQPPPHHELVPGKALMKALAWGGRACWISQHFQLRPGTCGGGRKTSVSSSRLDHNRLRDREMLHLQRWFPLVKPSPLVLSSASKSTEKSTDTSVLPHICHRLKE